MRRVEAVRCGLRPDARAAGKDIIDDNPEWISAAASAGAGRSSRAKAWSNCAASGVPPLLLDASTIEPAVARRVADAAASTSLHEGATCVPRPEAPAPAESPAD